ncbi:hypothetical protein CAE01nite_23720 [Cellulomonas aerilata]|uniref:Uncharacterized protein n=1 Tax=Cellulomonas aerilata TaxID=515326 RepID=A0A512DDX7_9CELL|nr:hypothetical protein CAE01nite_23720 [Cellulomonas aerilata]
MRAGGWRGATGRDTGGRRPRQSTAATLRPTGGPRRPRRGTGAGEVHPHGRGGPARGTAYHGSAGRGADPHPPVLWARTRHALTAHEEDL